MTFTRAVSFFALNIELGLLHPFGIRYSGIVIKMIGLAITILACRYHRHIATQTLSSTSLIGNDYRRQGLMLVIGFKYRGKVKRFATVKQVGIVAHTELHTQQRPLQRKTLITYKQVPFVGTLSKSNGT